MIMDISLSQILYWVALPLLAWVFKALVINRIEQIEQKVESMVNETQVRQIISDKIDPIQVDVREIKNDLRSLFLIQLNEKIGSQDNGTSK